MADGLFGTPTGFRTYDRDQAELGLLAGQTRHQDALTGLNRAQAEVLLRKQGAEEEKVKALAAIANGGGGATLGSGTAPTFDMLIEQGRRQAGALFAVGDVEGAQKATNDAATAMSRVASGEAAEARKTVSESQATIAKIERLQGLLAGVNGPQSHAAFLMAAKADPLLGQDALPPELMTYNPAVVQRFIAGSDALKRQVEMADSQARTAAYVATQASARGRHAVLNAQGERMLELRADRNATLAKVGGTTDKPVGPPSTAAVKAMATALNSEGLLVTGTAGEAQALELAERAKRLVYSTKGALTETEARAKVIQEAQAAGEILPPEPMKRGIPDIFGGAAKPGAFTPQAGTITRPAPLPTSRADLVPGRYYRDPKSGKMKQYTGTAFVDVAQAAMNPLAEEDDGGEE